MGLADDIKKNAENSNVKIQSSEAAKLEKILNKMFYLEKNVEEETAFVKQVMTRGLQTQERIGLHASAMTASDKKFCVRQQVLSLLYKQLQGEQLQVGLKRIFEEGNAIHEKWQRLFIRAGYGKAKDMDRSRFNDEYELSFTPDGIVYIPEFYDGKMVVEIKSMNTFSFKHATSHPSGRKQMQFYLWLTGIKKGFVLAEDKNTQEIKIFLEDYDPETVAPFIDRLEQVKFYKQRALEEHKMVGRHELCKKSNCKMAEDCPMRDACWNIGIGRVRL